jgi:replicative DNA helicase
LRSAVNRSLEKLALWIITQNKSPSLKLFSLLNEDHFQDRYNKLVFKRIKNIAKKRSIILSWDSLLDDTTIPEDARTILTNFTRETPITNTRIHEVYEELDKYRKIRLVYTNTKDIIEEKLLNAESVDIDKITDDLGDLVSKLRSSSDDSDFYMFGKQNNIDHIVEDLLSPDGGIRLIPSGIKGWDRHNGGLPQKSVMLVGAPTGKFKSLLADCLCDNFSDYGAKTCFVSLEMDIDEMLVRRLARYSSIDQTKILNADRITDSERIIVRKEYQARKRELALDGKTIYTKVPRNNPSIDELLMQLKPFGFKVIIIDYVSLLKGMDGPDQHRKLSDAIAYGKVFSRNTGCLLIILVQIRDEEGNLVLKFSKAMEDHSDLCWFWSIDKSFEETGIFKITVPKARKQKAISFYVQCQPEFARIIDVPRDYRPPKVKDMVNKELQTRGRAPSSSGNNSRNNRKRTDDDKLLDDHFRDEDDDRPRTAHHKYSQKNHRMAHY